MSASAVIDSEQPTASPTVLKPEAPVYDPASEFKIEHSYELLDDAVLAEQTPALLQCVRLEEFKARIAHLECLILRNDNDKAEIVARELAQRLYLNDDKTTIISEADATPLQLQY